LEKITKKSGRVRHCHKKECHYRAQVAEQTSP
jgi:hypothetical protein